MIEIHNSLAQLRSPESFTKGELDGMSKSQLKLFERFRESLRSEKSSEIALAKCETSVRNLRDAVMAADDDIRAAAPAPDAHQALRAVIEANRPNKTPEEIAAKSAADKAFADKLAPLLATRDLYQADLDQALADRVQATVKLRQHRSELAQAMGDFQASNPVDDEAVRRAAIASWKPLPKPVSQDHWPLTAALQGRDKDLSKRPAPYLLPGARRHG
jgi:hypothetical protein